MGDLILNSALLDALGLTGFVTTFYLLAGPVRRKPKRLRVVAGVRCWCKAFGGKRTDCYCVSFLSDESTQDGVK